MANLVKNELTFKGDKKVLEKFLKDFESKDELGQFLPFSFNKIYPTPLSADMPEWRMMNWKVDRDIDSETEKVEVKDGFVFTFCTRFNAPLGVYNRLAELIRKQKLSIDFYVQWSAEEYISSGGSFEYDSFDDEIYLFYDETYDDIIERYIELWADGDIEKTTFYKDKDGHYGRYCIDANYECENCKKPIKC